MLGRLGRQLLVQGFRTAPRSIYAMSFTTNPIQRGFSDVVLINKGIKKLNRILDEEIKLEEDNYVPLDSTQVFLSESGFEMTTLEGNVDIRLAKMVGDKQVEILFKSRQPMMESEELEVPQDEEQDNPNSNFAGEDTAEFSVIVKNKEGAGFIAECSTYDTEVNIMNVMYSNNVDEDLQTNAFERHTQMYQGPDFQTLDERLQHGFIEYLEGLGINERLAAFVEAASLDKDQQLYMLWLKNTKEFIQD